MKIPFKYTAPILGLALATTSANAATIAHTHTELARGLTADTIKYSIFDYDSGGAKFEAPDANGSIGSGTLLQYRYYGNSGSTWVERGSAGSGFLSAATPGTVGNRNATETVNVWDQTDPGATFSTTPDFTASSGVASVGIAGSVTGTVNISNLTGGSLFLLYGVEAGNYTQTFTMTGPGQVDQTTTFSPGFFGRGTNVWWLGDIEFDNSDLLYTEITYDITIGGSTNANRGRFGFVAVEGTVIPEPTTALLGSLGLLALLRRRR